MNFKASLSAGLKTVVPVLAIDPAAEPIAGAPEPKVTVVKPS